MDADDREHYGKIAYAAAIEAIIELNPSYITVAPKWEDISEKAREVHRASAEAVAQAIALEYCNLKREAEIVLQIIEKQPKPQLGEWDWPRIADRLRQAVNGEENK